MSFAYRRNKDLKEARKVLNECRKLDNIPLQIEEAVLRSLSEIEKAEGNIEGQIRNLEMVQNFQSNNTQTGFITNILLGYMPT